MRRNGDREERKLGSCLASSPITRAWVGWGLALSPPFSPQLQIRRVRAPPLLVPFSAFVSREEFESSDKRRQKMELVQRQGKRHPASRAGNLSYRRWRWEEEEEEPEKTEVEFQIQNERRHKSKEEEDENDKVAVGEELRHVRSIALKNQLYAAVGAPLLTTIFFFSIKEVKHKVEEEEDKHGDDCELDLLYIVHSDISYLLHQEDPSLMTARVFSNAAANQSLQAPKQDLNHTNQYVIGLTLYDLGSKMLASGGTLGARLLEPRCKSMLGLSLLGALIVSLCDFMLAYVDAEIFTFPLEFFSLAIY
ncbi:hypothetical protein Bca101_050828 [Brassica carinata]